MKARIFRRLLWGALLLFLAVLALLDLWLEGFTAARQRAQIEDRLRFTAELLSRAAQGQSNWQSWVRSVATAQQHVSVLDAAGRTLADSQPDAAPDSEISVKAALPRGGVLRVAESADQLRELVNGLRMRVLGAALFSILLTAVIAYLFMASFAGRIQRMRTYVEGLLESRVPESELPSADDELGALALSLRRTAPRIRDVVQRLQVEGARREAILSSMVEGVLAIDKDSRVTFCNDSFARTLGTRAPVPSGMPLTDLVRDPGLLDIMTSALTRHERLERRITLTGNGGHSFEVLAAPLESGPQRGALALLHDTTKLERLERVRKDFVANVSHELRTPLAAIRGYAETLLDGALEDSEHNRQFVEVILAHSIRLNNIASDLLTLSELESSNTASAQPKRVSIRASLEAALRTVESAARVRGVLIVANAIEDAAVVGHELRMEQAFVNLLDNAVKFNRANGEVRIETRRQDGFVMVEISDTGMGIPSEDLPRIFERFYRVDKARSRAVGGTGLGLSIVRHVIEQMRGTILVDSQLGQGSRFTIRLPLAEG